MVVTKRFCALLWFVVLARCGPFPELDREKRALSTVCVEIKPSINDKSQDSYFMCKGKAQSHRNSEDFGEPQKLRLNLEEELPFGYFPHDHENIAERRMDEFPNYYFDEKPVSRNMHFENPEKADHQIPTFQRRMDDNPYYFVKNKQFERKLSPSHPSVETLLRTKDQPKTFDQAKVDEARSSMKLIFESGHQDNPNVLFMTSGRNQLPPTPIILPPIPHQQVSSYQPEHSLNPHYTQPTVPTFQKQIQDRCCFESFPFFAKQCKPQPTLYPTHSAFLGSTQDILGAPQAESPSVMPTHFQAPQQQIAQSPMFPVNTPRQGFLEPRHDLEPHQQQRGFMEKLFVPETTQRQEPPPNAFMGNKETSSFMDARFQSFPKHPQQPVFDSRQQETPKQTTFMESRQQGTPQQSAFVESMQQETPKQTTFRQQGTPQQPVFDGSRQQETPKQNTFRQQGTPQQPAFGGSRQQETAKQPTFMNPRQQETPQQPAFVDSRQQETPKPPTFMEPRKQGTPQQPSFVDSRQQGPSINPQHSAFLEPSMTQQPRQQDVLVPFPKQPGFLEPRQQGIEDPQNPPQQPGFLEPRQQDAPKLKDDQLQRPTTSHVQQGVFEPRQPPVMTQIPLLSDPRLSNPAQQTFIGPGPKEMPVNLKQLAPETKQQPRPVEQLPFNPQTPQQPFFQTQQNPPQQAFPETRYYQQPQQSLTKDQWQDQLLGSPQAQEDTSTPVVENPLAKSSNVTEMPVTTTPATTTTLMSSTVSSKEDSEEVKVEDFKESKDKMGSIVTQLQTFAGKIAVGDNGNNGTTVISSHVKLDGVEGSGEDEDRK